MKTLFVLIRGQFDRLPDDITDYHGPVAVYATAYSIDDVLKQLGAMGVDDIFNAEERARVVQCLESYGTVEVAGMKVQVMR